MKPLEKGQQILSWYGIRSEEPFTKGRRIVRLIFVTLLPISVLTCELSSILFFMKYVTVDFNAAVFSLLQIAIYFGLFYTMVVVAFSRREITDIFENLSKIYDACKITSNFSCALEAFESNLGLTHFNTRKMHE